MPRPVGSVNKRSAEVRKRLEDLDCDPIEGMATIAKEAKTERDFQLAGQMYKELAKYWAPQLKAVEVSGPDGGDVPLAQTIEIVPVSASADK